MSRTWLRTLALGLAAACGCAKSGDGPDGGSGPPGNMPPPEVDVAKPLVKEIQQYCEYTGRMDAVENVEVRARVKGFLNKIHFKEGTEVKRGQLLYEIDPREYQAELDKANADLKRSEAQLALAKSELARAGRLARSESGSQEDLLRKDADKQVADAAILQAKAAVQAASLQLGYTNIHAEIEGRISRALVTEGNLVGSPDATLLTTIRKLDPIYVYFQAPERGVLEYDKRAKEQGLPSATDGKVPVYVGLDSETLLDDGKYPHKGVINWRENRVDANTGTIMIRGVLENPDRVMKPGMFARVRVPIGAPAKALLVPEVAVAIDQRGRYLMVVGKDSKAESRIVRTGQVDKNGMVVVESSLTAEGKPNPRMTITADDRVIVNGLQRVRDGGPVVPKEASPGAEASAAAAGR